MCWAVERRTKTKTETTTLRFYCRPGEETDEVGKGQYQRQ